jgi:hypothetical protein
VRQALGKYLKFIRGGKSGGDKANALPSLLHCLPLPWVCEEADQEAIIEYSRRLRAGCQ